jgi:protein TonB
MKNVKELTVKNVSLVLMFAVLAAGYYFVAQHRVANFSQSLVFAGEEVLVSSVAKPAVQVASKAISAPTPMPTAVAPLPIFPPKIIYSVLPQYPSSALSQGLEGTTLLSVYVGLNGAAEKVEVKASSGLAELDDAAAAAVAQWKFNPALQGGTAIASCFEVPVRFDVN